MVMYHSFKETPPISTGSLWGEKAISVHKKGISHTVPVNCSFAVIFASVVKNLLQYLSNILPFSNAPCQNDCKNNASIV